MNMNVGKNKNTLFFGKMKDGLHYDIHEPSIGHFNRFQAKLKQQEKPKKKQNWYKYIAIAASLLLFISIGFKSINKANQSTDLSSISPKMEDTQNYFTAVIHQELKKIEKIQNPTNQKIINDALLQIQVLEDDYKSQKIALSINSKNKNVIYAMVNNYQKRIEVLQNLLNELNKFNNIKKTYHENSI